MGSFLLNKQKMINTNSVVINFVKDNYILLIISLMLIIILPLKIIPPEWAGFWKYNNNKKNEGQAPKITILQFFLNNVFDGTLRSFFIPMLVAFNLKNTITFIILSVVIVNILSLKQISPAAITLVGIGILALYLEKLIETGRSIKFFGLLTWEKDSRQQTTVNSNDSLIENHISKPSLPMPSVASKTLKSKV